MQVDLTLEQQSFVQEAIKSGRLRRPEAAVHQALAMWEEQKRTLNWQQSLWTRPQLYAILIAKPGRCASGTPSLIHARAENT
jgi:hypothetical protein